MKARKREKEQWQFLKRKNDEFVYKTAIDEPFAKESCFQVYEKRMSRHEKFQG